MQAFLRIASEALHCKRTVDVNNLETLEENQRRLTPSQLWVPEVLGQIRMPDFVLFFLI